MGVVLSISDRRKVSCGRGQSELFGGKNFAPGGHIYCTTQKEIVGATMIPKSRTASLTRSNCGM